MEAVAFFMFLALVIIVPLWLRHRLQTTQLEVIAKALERGVDPERIQIRLPQAERDDPNGNWKAGVMLNVIGGAFAVLMLTMLGLSNELGTGKDDVYGVLILPGMCIAIGCTLLYFHRRIIGGVHRAGEPRGTDAAGLL